MLDVDDVPDFIKSPRAVGAAAPDEEGASDGGSSGVHLETAEKELIRQALALSQGNREKAAQLLQELETEPAGEPAKPAQGKKLP